MISQEAHFTFLDTGHIATPKGWQAGVAASEIRYRGRNDLALLVSERLCTAAALFTTNKVKAAPVLYDQALLERNSTGIQAVVINSGIANACTGEPGLAATLATAENSEKILSLPKDSVFVMSTGVIGMQLPVEKLLFAIKKAAQTLDSANGPAAARAIMTTDTCPKSCALQVLLPSGGQIQLGGMAKGAGMIHPNMATLLSLITTDAVVNSTFLHSALQSAADRSFHCISIDGDTSTNDTLLVLANGCSGVEICDSADEKAFIEGLTLVCQRLAQEIVRDGEGATRFVTIEVCGALNDDAARQAGMTIAKSALVKTALFGADPNWGRVVCALGYSGVEFEPERVILHFGGMKVFEHGLPLNFDEKTAHNLLNMPEVLIKADLGLGEGKATIWTCDFSYEYVKINAEYRT